MIPKIKLKKHPITHVEIIEEWRPIKGYNGVYEISNYGRVKSLSKMKKNGKNSTMFCPTKLLSLRDSSGYKRVVLYNSGMIKKQFKVHRLVASSFVIKPNKDYNIIDHIDGDTANNFYSNLRWCNTRLNLTYAYLKKDVSSKYTGVSFDKSRNKFEAYISLDGRKKHLGRFSSESDASNAYQNALTKIK